jgi:hypothetical protein
VLVEQSGEDFYRGIEALRRTARSARDGAAGPDWHALQATLDGILQDTDAHVRLRRLADGCGAFRLFLALAGFGTFFTPTDLYVAWTRARHRLILVCQSGDIRAAVEAALADAERSATNESPAEVP